jgi:hypothetical protein
MDNVGHHDYNFFGTVTVTGESTFPTTPQIQSAFRGPRRMMFVGVTGNNIYYSFSGTNIHGRISAGQIFNFDVRAESKVYFYGTGVVDVHMWHVGV